MFVKVSAYGFQNTFFDTEDCFHMIIHKALFITIVPGVLMYGARHAELTVTVEMNREAGEVQKLQRKKIIIKSEYTEMGKYLISYRLFCISAL